MEKELRIIISGGGTGGHIFPAVSIANAIIEPVSYTHLFIPCFDGGDPRVTYFKYLGR